MAYFVLRHRVVALGTTEPLVDGVHTFADGVRDSALAVRLTSRVVLSETPKEVYRMIDGMAMMVPFLDIA